MSDCRFGAFLPGLGLPGADDRPTAALAAGTTPLVDPGDSVTAEFTIRVEDA